MKEIIVGAVAGIFSTFLMDLVSSRLRQKGWIQGISPKMLGKWVLGLARGHLCLENPFESKESTYELKVAVLSHYLIGAVLGSMYIISLGKLNITEKVQTFAFTFGLFTNVFPWFILFPALGFGIFGLRGPKEMRLFRTSLFNHSIYGAGLFLFFTLFK